MGFFEDAASTAKEVFDVAAKKTNEVVTVQKLRYKVSQTNSKLSKDFETLGRLYFEKVKESGDYSEYKEIIESIDEKFALIEDYEDQIAIAKNSSICSKCGGKNPKNAAFCSKCGAKL